MALLDMVGLERLEPAKVKTPLLVLGAARDNMLSRSEIEATARAYHTHAEIIPEVAHNSMLEQRWEAVADRISGVVDGACVVRGSGLHATCGPVRSVRTTFPPDVATLRGRSPSRPRRSPSLTNNPFSTRGVL
jgi:hypothetical protein